ncbi:MAG: 16S rRNA (uracil(1498)-N(3))-methyltransferase [Candidatus Omnitrophica bacterium]|nr:16S rRNA (uracil(1498)-N(3))-methyltransferase [Candidatus Omnitrophota bacterium]
MKPTRRLRRFFFPHPLPTEKGKIWLPASETHHLRHILRLKPGDRCLITDGFGKQVEARIENFSEDDKTLMTILECENPAKGKSSAPSSSLFIRICQALPQRGKMDEMIEKAQELGADEIWPMETSRTVVKMSRDNSAKVLARWNKIAREAVKQSGSCELVKISEPKKLEQILKEIPKEEKVALFHPGAEALPFQNWIKLMEKISPKKVTLFLGPEGGFSESEIAAVRSGRTASANVVSLGENILKADTAFLAVISALRLLYPKNRHSEAEGRRIPQDPSLRSG